MEVGLSAGVGQLCQIILAPEPLWAQPRLPLGNFGVLLLLHLYPAPTSSFSQLLTPKVRLNKHSVPQALVPREPHLQEQGEEDLKRKDRRM